MNAELEQIEAFLIDQGHGVITADSPEWARRLDQACDIVRTRWASLNEDEPDDDWGDAADQILMLEQERDELAARAAASQAKHATELEQIATRIAEILNKHQNPTRPLMALAADIQSKAGAA